MLPYYKRADLKIPPHDLVLIHAEVERMWESDQFIRRKVSPPSMYGVALYSCGDHVLNNYPSYKCESIKRENADWTPASRLCPTLTKWLRLAPVSWQRVILWSCLEGYEQPWHRDDVSVIVHLAVKKPLANPIMGCAWRPDTGEIVYDDIEEGEFFYFNPRIEHSAYNHSPQRRYEITGFVDNLGKKIFER